jgi:hypothetical protein
MQLSSIRFLDVLFRLNRPLIVEVFSSNGTWTAIAGLLNISETGRDQVEAINNLKRRFFLDWTSIIQDNDDKLNDAARELKKKMTDLVKTVIYGSN